MATKKKVPTKGKKPTKGRNPQGPTKGRNPQGPTNSATKYPVGAILRGNDGNNWITVKHGKTQRWVCIKDTSKIFKTNNKGTITWFNLGELCKDILPKISTKNKLIKLGTLDITGNSIGVGEFIFLPLPAKKGKYDIYYVLSSLIAIPTGKDPMKEEFKITPYVALCDAGCFSFNDFSRIKQHQGKKRKERGGKNIFEDFPPFDADLLLPKSPNRINKLDAYRIYLSDIETFDGKKSMATPVAYFVNNCYGDGIFEIYKSKNAYLIMSKALYSSMLCIYTKVKMDILL